MSFEENAEEIIRTLKDVAEKLERLAEKHEQANMDIYYLQRQSEYLRQKSDEYGRTYGLKGGCSACRESGVCGCTIGPNQPRITS